jgi:hypothetical protein
VSHSGGSSFASAALRHACRAAPTKQLDEWLSLSVCLCLSLPLCLCLTLSVSMSLSLPPFPRSRRCTGSSRSTRARPSRTAKSPLVALPPVTGVMI